MLFTLLLCVATGVPVLTASAADGAEESPPAAEAPAPSAQELALVEGEQREHDEWLSSPEAIRQREASRGAFANLSAGEAQSLLLEAFPVQLKQLNGDPARVLSTLEVEKPLGTHAARVETGEGESAILDSSVPVESEVGGEGKEPVDLSLERSGNSFVPRNPITEVELPGSAEEPIQLQSGVEVELPASDDHDAEPIGAMNLFYPETETATDTLVAPRAGGVEVFEQLRSPESPERFSFALHLPDEATLRPSEAGGAEVINSSGQVIEEVPPPSATDAQGATVPVTTSVEGNSLILEVPHRSREVAYPLLLDPEYVNDTTSFGEWSPSLNSGYEYYLNNNGSSLDAISRGNYYYPAYTHGQWAYGAYGETAYIAAATFSSVHYIVHTCQTYEPHGYIGLYNSGSGSYDALGVYATWSSEGKYETGWKGGTGTRAAIIGIGTNGSGVEIGCAHELYVGGYSIQEKDPYAPSLSVSGVPSGWFDPAKAGNATVNATDTGLGLHWLSMEEIGGGSVHDQSLSCNGANGSRCPRDRSWPVAPPYKPGERTFQVTAEDPVENVGKWTTTTKVDSVKPEIALGGQLAYVTEEEGLKGEENEASENQLSLPVYNLHIEATDGNENGSPSEWQSGVKSIEVFLDGAKQEVPWGVQGCSRTQSSCPMVENYQLKLLGLSAGEHKLKVVATDQVNLPREREIEFEYIPATGMKDEYVMQHFPLPDGEGNESEEEHPNRPELAVNVTNGNLVYRQKDVEVTTPAVDLEVERFYNSQLPEEDNTEWGDGWTLAQTPALEPEESKNGPPSEATVLQESGAVESQVELPTKDGEEVFDESMQAVVTKEPGGYEVTDQSGESADAVAFNEAGEATELRTPGYASVEYEREGGELSEIAVEDPASAHMTGNELEELRNQTEVPNWSLQTTPNPPATPIEAKFKDVSCKSSTMCLAVGEDKQRERVLGQLWNGSKWEALPFLEESTYAGTRSGVSCTSTTNCMVVGSSEGNAIVERWKTFGEGWFLLSTWYPEAPSGGAEVNLTSISCTATSACTAVGSYVKESTTKSLAERYNGSEWTVQSTPNPESGTAALAGVSCDSATSCTAIGATYAMHWNGSSWTASTAAIPSGATQTTLLKVSCSSSSFCIAVGRYKEATGYRKTLTERYNGSSWSVLSTPNPSEAKGNVELLGVSCTSTTSCFAVGSYVSAFWEEGPFASEVKTLAESYNGATWSLQSTPNPEGSSEIKLSGVSCTASTECTAVGSAGVSILEIGDMVTLAQRWNGTAWSLQTTPNPPATPIEAKFKDVSCKSSTMCLAVGEDKQRERVLGQLWNGSKWEALLFLEESTYKGTRSGVSCTSTTNCVVVGSENGEAVAERWKTLGEGWMALSVWSPEVPPGGSQVSLASVSCTAANACTAVGSYVKEGATKSLAERYNGSEWTVQSTPNPESGAAALASVSCDSATSCSAIGATYAMHWNGSSWTASTVPSPSGATTTALQKVSCSSSSFCIAVGNYKEATGYNKTLVERWNGNSWSVGSSPNPEGAKGSYLSDVSCTSSGACTAVGRYVAALWEEVGPFATETKTLTESWNGSTWSLRSTPSPEGSSEIKLSGISCLRGVACTAVGSAGVSIVEIGDTVTLGERVGSWPEPADEDDPRIDVETSSGLVESVAGDEAGTTTYSHEGEMLTAVDSPKGETQYEYDSQERLTKVTLANGTWGEIKYGAYGRVESVTVSVEGGKAETTQFTYSDEPRETVVAFEKDPTVHYQIGADGSVLKWWNAKVPPEIEELTGSLYTERGEVHPDPISSGDQTLNVKAHAWEGVASIQIVANGDQLVAEKTCEESKCIKLEKELVTETQNWPPGILQLEVIVTDTFDQTSSERFWDNIPYTPPPEPEALEPPKFEDILHFREEFGLDLDIKGNEQAVTERIFELIAAWHDPDSPAGEVARATMERWGVPLRAVDAAELEYRIAYEEQASTAIPAWAETNAPSTYAGYYFDERAGGIIRVGFTSNQASMVEQLKSGANLMAPSRVESFTYQPTRSIGDLNSLQNAVIEASTATGSPSQIFSVDLDVEHNGVKVGTAEVSQTNEYMSQKFGQQESLTAYFEAHAPPELAGRYQTNQPFLAGEEIQNSEHYCAAGFGAWSRVGTKANGEPIKHRYVLTAGHCFPLGVGQNAAEVIYRAHYEGDAYPVRIGTTERRGFLGNPNQFDTDAEAIQLEDPSLVPGWVYECCGGRAAMRPTGVTYPKVGQVLCQSGLKSNAVLCGPMLGAASAGRLENATTHQLSGWHWMIHVGAGGEPGDSGSPVWVRDSGEVVGLVVGGGAGGLAVQPLIRPPNVPVGQVAGVLSDPHMSPSAKPLHVQLGP